MGGDGDEVVGVHANSAVNVGEYGAGFGRACHRSLHDDPYNL